MILVDVTPLYDLGQVGELDLLGGFDDFVIPDAVVEEVSVEPAASNLDRFVDEYDVVTGVAVDAYLEDARALLNDGSVTSDAVLVACLLAAREADEEAGLVSDDRRLRAIAKGLGATVTGTFGVVVQASMGETYFTATQAKRVVRRTDHHGVQMTGQLRERAIGEFDA